MHEHYDVRVTIKLYFKLSNKQHNILLVMACLLDTAKNSWATYYQIFDNCETKNMFSFEINSGCVGSKTEAALNRRKDNHTPVIWQNSVHIKKDCWTRQKYS